MYSEELNKIVLYTNVTRTIKSERRWAEHVALTEEIRNLHKILIGKSRNLQGADRLLGKHRPITQE